MKLFASLDLNRYLLLLQGFGLLLTMTIPTVPPASAFSDPKSMTAAEQRLVYRAQQAMAKAHYDEARQMLSAFIQKQPGGGHYLVVFTLANALAKGGHAEIALKHYKAVVAANPSDAAVWQNMGKVYHDLGQYAEAGRSLIKAHELHQPPAPATAYQAAAAFIMAGKPEEARPILEKLIRDAGAAPKSEWRDALLKVYLDLGLEGDALVQTRHLIEKEGHRPHLWQALAQIHINRKAYAEAAAALEIFGSLAPMDAEKTELLGNLYLMAGVPAKAAQLFETLLSIEPSASVFEKTASAYLAALRKDEAVAVLERGTRHQATFRMWWNLAALHYEAGRFEKAYQAFERCTRFNTNAGGARLMMGYSALQAEHLQDAATAFRQAADHPEQRAEARKMMAHIEKMNLSHNTADPKAGKTAEHKEVTQETIP